MAENESRKVYVTLTRRVGNTNYKVRVHFNGEETMEDDVFTMLLMYLSAIFYKVETFSATVQRLFLCNPVYCYIKYFRVVVLEGNIPSLPFHLLCAFYAVAVAAIGGLIYKMYNHSFLYYV